MCNPSQNQSERGSGIITSCSNIYNNSNVFRVSVKDIVMSFVIVQIFILALLLLSVRNIRQFACRRSPRREHMLTIAGGFWGIGVMLQSGAYLVAGSPSNGILGLLGQFVMCGGYIWMMAAVIGWDRMAISVPGWGRALQSQLLVIVVMGVCWYTSWTPWADVPVWAGYISMVLIDIVFLGHIVAYRRWIIFPFLSLHLIAASISMLATVNGALDSGNVAAWMYTVGTTTGIFWIVSMLLQRGEYQRRMMIV